MLKETVVLLAFALVVNCQNSIQNSNIDKFDKFSIDNDNEAIVKAAVEIVSSFYIKTTSTLNFITSTSSDESRFNTDDIVEEISNSEKEDLQHFFCRFIRIVSKDSCANESNRFQLSRMVSDYCYKAQSIQRNAEDV
jgi:hypothetical protein